MCILHFIGKNQITAKIRNGIQQKLEVNRHKNTKWLCGYEKID